MNHSEAHPTQPTAEQIIQLIQQLPQGDRAQVQRHLSGGVTPFTVITGCCNISTSSSIVIQAGADAEAIAKQLGGLPQGTLLEIIKAAATALDQ